MRGLAGPIAQVLRWDSSHRGGMIGVIVADRHRYPESVLLALKEMLQELERAN